MDFILFFWYTRNFFFHVELFLSEIENGKRSLQINLPRSENLNRANAFEIIERTMAEAMEGGSSGKCFDLWQILVRLKKENDNGKEACHRNNVGFGYNFPFSFDLISFYFRTIVDSIVSFHAFSLIMSAFLQLRLAIKRKIFHVSGFSCFTFFKSNCELHIQTKTSKL